MSQHTAFRRAVETDDLAALRACLRDDATFHSPAVHQPYRGVGAVMLILRAVTRVFEDFRYTGAFTGDDGRELLEFRARVGSRVVQGVDVLTFDEDGMVLDLTVLVRPFRGLEALIGAMERQLGAGPTTDGPPAGEAVDLRSRDADDETGEPVVADV